MRSILDRIDAVNKRVQMAPTGPPDDLGAERVQMRSDSFQLLATVIAAVVPFVLYVTIGDYIKRERLWKMSLADLIAEIKQNQEYQKLRDGRWMFLERDAYKLLMRRGFTMRLEQELLDDLRKLYSHVQLKSSRIKYYESYMALLTDEERKNNSETLIAPILEVTNEIDVEINKILPKLTALLADP